ncbi:hypothetical protein QR680_005597 [Steinernema hermaphroditum]|uniref:Transcription initiation factor IIA subunit 1 n=1 Tax=Steinernema hermaphroditum TaxID=289476 RepID=A0AA39HUT9_9BILA|nr:hypothetical protein QR680_005597 [Steinernema hermaphroditum]
MAQQTSGHTIEDIYKAVISDVISQVKEAFLDENIDIDVLHQLKKEWEDKVNASGCVDMEGTRQLRTPDTQPVLPPPTFKIGGPWNPPPREPPTFMRVQGTDRISRCDKLFAYLFKVKVWRESPSKGNSHFRRAPGILLKEDNSSSLYLNKANLWAHRLLVQFLVFRQAQCSPLSLVVKEGLSVYPQAKHKRCCLRCHIHCQEVSKEWVNLDFSLSSSVCNQPGTQPVYLPVSANGTPLMNSNPNIRAPVTQSGSSRPLDTTTVHQLDGAVQLDGEGADDPSSSSGIVIEAKDVKYVKLNKRQMKKLAEKMSKMLVTQLDGGGGGMTDSSSEDEEEEDPLQTFVNKIDEGGEEGDEQVREEEPLNSDDDQSDDEDLETLFDADDVVMCQFEKVHRARQKWKFSLKDGVMQIHGKDYVFSKCSGEAEW